MPLTPPTRRARRMSAPAPECYVTFAVRVCRPLQRAQIAPSRGVSWTSGRSRSSSRLLLKRVCWSVMGGHKTLAGSLAFAAVAVGIGLLMGLGTGDVRILAVFGAGLVLALVEGSLGYGLDNLPVPAVGSLLGISMLGL